MVIYRRNYIKGGTYFFTVNLRNRKLSLLTKYIIQLRNAYNKTKREHPFKTHAYAVMPDHLHVIWELPEDDSNYSLRWRKIKRYFTNALLKLGIPIFKNKHNECNIWQRRFWEHTIRDQSDFENHVNYIHANPTKHGLVKNMLQWPYSSIHWYVQHTKANQAAIQYPENFHFGEK